VDHADVICDPAAISGEEFAIEEVVQTIEPDGYFRLLLVHRGVGHSFAVQNHGKWCSI
jgi:hypothetical protein